MLRSSGAQNIANNIDSRLRAKRSKIGEQEDSPMLDTLAGRLTWEQTGQGIRVEIPARKSWSILILVLWLILWCGAGWLFLYKTHNAQTYSHAQLFWLVVWSVVVLRTIAAVLWTLYGSTMLILDTNQLQIANRIMGLQLSVRSFANADVRGLRFVPSIMRARTVRPSGIWFLENNKLRQFAPAITETEALALIDKMLQVYKFPIDSAWGYRSTSP